MNTTKPIYETGATSHAVNDLILFTDNTRELAEMRDNIYKRAVTPMDIVYSNYRVLGEDKGMQSLTGAFSQLFRAAQSQYIKEFPHSNNHISQLHWAWEGGKEYCTLYAKDFPNWKKENGYS